MRKIRTSRRRVKIGFEGIVNSVDEKLIDYAHTKHAYNVAFDKGLLTSYIGIDRAQGITSSGTRFDFSYLATSKYIKNVFHYRYYNAGTIDDRIIVHLQDGTLWQTKALEQAGWVQIGNLTLTGDVEAVNYRYNGEDILLLATENASLYYLKGDVLTEVSAAPHFASIEIYNERVFGCVNGAKTRLWFSDDFNPTNWNVNSQDAGFIEFADECGDLLKVVSFLGHLYVFRDYGIFRLIGYGDQSTFTLKKVFTDTGRIYKKTIVHCGDRIVFLADEGLFSFDGYDVVRIGKELPEITKKNYAVGAYMDKKYYLACSATIDSSYTISNANANAVLILNLFDKSLSVLAGLDICAQCAVKTHGGAYIVCCFGSSYKNRLGMFSQSGKLFTDALSKKYKSPFTDLGTTAHKTVRYITVTTEYNVTLKVILDNNTYTYSLTGNAKPQKIIVEKCGVKFGIELSTTINNLVISPMVATIDVMEE